MADDFSNAIAITLGSARMMMSVAQALKDMDERIKVINAVFEVSEKLMDATAVAMAAQEKQTTLTQRIAELEKENEQLKNWDTEREQYALVEPNPGFFAYCRKPEIETSEPVHHLCANCFTKYEKAILQLERTSLSSQYCCLRCDRKIMVR